MSSIVDIDRAISADECILFSHDRESAIKKHLNPGDNNYEFALLQQLFQRYRNGETSVKKEIDRMIKAQTGNTGELELQRDLLAFDNLNEKEKKQVREKIRRRLNPHDVHQKMVQRGKFNNVIEERHKKPSRFDPVVTKVLLNELDKRTRVFQKYSKAALGHIIQQNLSDDQNTALVNNLSNAQLAMLPNITKILESHHRNLMSKRKNDRDRHQFWSYDNKIRMVMELMTLEQLRSLPTRVRLEVRVIGFIMKRLRPLDFDEEEPESKIKYAEILLEFAEKELRGHEGNDSLKIELWGSIISENWRLDERVDMESFIKFLRLRLSCPYFRTGRFQPEYERKHINLQDPVHMPGVLTHIDDTVIEEILQKVFSECVARYSSKKESILQTYVWNKIGAESGDKELDSLRDCLRPEIFRWFRMEAKLFAGLDKDGSAFRYLTNYQNKVLGRRLPSDTATSSELEFVRNKKSFVPDELVMLNVKVKNVKEIMVKVFQINLKTYYRKNMSEVQTDLNLDGLTAKEEWTEKVEASNSFHRQIIELKFPSLVGKRGIFFVDLIGNGLHARAMIKKGAIYLLTRLSVSGHVFSLIDENKEALDGGKIFMEGHEFTANENGDIYIPYSTRPKNQQIIVESDRYPDFCILEKFYHQAESYDFSAAFYIDREQIMDKKEGSLLVRSCVKANGSISPLKICKNVVITVTSTNTTGVSSTKTFDRVNLKDDEDTVLKFRVPMRCRSIRVNLTGRIKNVSKNTWQNINASSKFDVNDLVLGETIENAHLIAQPQGYAIAYYGRNGEPLPNVQAYVQVKSKILNQPITRELMTDEKGFIYLPVVEDCEWISAFGTSWRLKAPRIQQSGRKLKGEVGRRISVPYLIPSCIQGFDRNDLRSICRLVDSSYRYDFTQSVSLRSDDVLMVSGLKAGTYMLQMRDDTSFEIEILQGKTVKNYVLGQKRFIELPHEKNLRILNVEKKDKTVVVEVSAEKCRLHAFATHMHPRFDAMENLALNSSEAREEIQVRDPESLYCKTRNISEEQRYIVERAKADSMIGNMLQKPSMLMKPKASEEATTRVREARRGDRMLRSKNAAYQARSAAHDYSRAHLERAYAAGAPSRKDEYIEFLSATGVVLTNLKPTRIDGKYLIEIDLEKFAKDHTFCQLLLNDGVSLASHHFSLSLSDKAHDEKTDLNIPSPEYKYIDQRLIPGLDPGVNFTERKIIQLLNKENSEFHVEDYKGSEVEFYDNAKDLFQLFKTLYDGSNLEEWSFLSRWSFLSEEDKMDKFDKYTSHELNFFLYLKDSDFFKSVAEPFIQSKLNKGLIDYYLLGEYEALEVFTEMSRFDNLNHLERILLGDAMREIKPDFYEATITYYEKAGQAEKIDPKELERLFSTVLAGKIMEEEPVISNVRSRAAPQSAYAMRAESEEMDMGLSDMIQSKAFFGGYSHRSTAECYAVSDKEEEEFDLVKAREDNFERDLKERAAMKKSTLYRAIDTTKIYEETFYYNKGYRQSTSNLVPMNKFWCDFGVWFLGDQSQEFLSENMALPTSNLNECLFALAVFGLDFESEGVKVHWEENHVSVKITSEKPAVVFSKEIKETETRNSSISIHQFYFDPSNQSEVVDGERVDKFVTNFHPRQVYGCRAVLTNISSAPLRNLEVLKQIPAGSIALNNKDATETELVTIPAYGTKIIEFKFYFPDVGTFRHFPIQVAKKNYVIGSGNVGKLEVALPQAKKEVNVESWQDVALNGHPKTVITYLENHNVYKMRKDGDLNMINWRLSNKDFWTDYVRILRSYGIYNSVVWGYAFKHSKKGDCDREIREYCADRSLKNPLRDPQFDSPLLSNDAFMDREYTHLEFFPLVNARAHQLGKKREILNDKLYTQYTAFIKLALSRSTSVKTMLAKDKLAAVYYLLIQDRFTEAIKVFDLIDADEANKASEFCYDYLRGYLNFLDEDQKVVKEVIDKYKNEQLVAAKRKLIQDFEKSLSALQGDFVYEPSENIDLADRDREMSKKASKEASLDFKVENREIKIEHFGLKSVTINYFKMDVELMFSNSPFSMSDSASGNFSFIQPTFSTKVELEDNGRVNMTTTKLPEHLENCNVYVEIVGGTQLKSTTYFDSNLLVQVKENFGQLQVINKVTKKPIKRAYVKVYAKTSSGDEFYKDGYTDIRGRFDYVAISSDQLPRTKRFALLVCTDKNGCEVRSAQPPKQ